MVRNVLAWIPYHNNIFYRMYLFYISESRLLNEWRILGAQIAFMSTSRKPLIAIVGVTSKRSENTQPWSNLCLCLQEQFLAAFCNIDKRHLCSSTISFADQTRVPYLYLGAYLCIAAIHEIGYMNNALNGEGKKILLYTNTA